MKFKLEKIEKIVSEIQGVSIDEGFSLDSNFNIIGKVTIDIENSNKNLAFEVKILPEYPLKTQNSEAILFSNIEICCAIIIFLYNFCHFRLMNNILFQLFQTILNYFLLCCSIRDDLILHELNY